VADVWLCPGRNVHLAPLFSPPGFALVGVFTLPLSLSLLLCVPHHPIFRSSAPPPIALQALRQPMAGHRHRSRRKKSRCNRNRSASRSRLRSSRVVVTSSIRQDRNMALTPADRWPASQMGVMAPARGGRPGRRGGRQLWTERDSLQSAPGTMVCGAHALRPTVSPAKHTNAFRPFLHTPLFLFVIGLNPLISFSLIIG